MYGFTQSRQRRGFSFTSSIQTRNWLARPVTEFQLAEVPSGCTGTSRGSLASRLDERTW
jgi:hypothetical protein